MVNFSGAHIPSPASSLSRILSSTPVRVIDAVQGQRLLTLISNAVTLSTPGNCGNGFVLSELVLIVTLYFRKFVN